MRTGLKRSGAQAVIAGAGTLLLAATALPARAEPPLRVVATTSLVGDFVRRVGGSEVDVAVLIPPDADPHAWQPRPADVARMVQADLVFENGLGLEEALERILRMPEIAPRRVAVSAGIETRRLSGCPGEGAHGHGHTHVHEPGEGDPHVWFDPVRVGHWARRIEVSLARLRPAQEAAFAERRAAVETDLLQLDEWIRAQVARIPEERRILVSDHESFGYFADRYGFRLAGAVIPGLSTLAQPSARDLARLQARLREEKIRAVFVGESANPVVARRLAADEGIAVVRLFTGSLSGADGPAADYFAFMRTNVTRIVGALE